MPVGLGHLELCSCLILQFLMIQTYFPQTRMMTKFVRNGKEVCPLNEDFYYNQEIIYTRCNFRMGCGIPFDRMAYVLDEIFLGKKRTGY